MPLPPALAKRLAARGLVNKRTLEQQARRADPEEEVFAESYDDTDVDAKARQKAAAPLSFPPAGPAAGADKDGDKYLGFPGCPNKWNVYHDCSAWCHQKWGQGAREPDAKYLRLFQEVMKTFGPLPDEWEEQYDPGSGRHFFWNRRTDRVSWLPPGHPKARITDPASHVREVLKSQLSNLQGDDDDEDEDEQAMDLDSDMESDEEEQQDRVIEEKRAREKERRREEEERLRRKNERTARHKAKAGSDPMDPSSYSDAPPGGWSAGLDKEDR